MTSEFLRRYYVLRIIKDPELYGLSRPYVSYEELKRALKLIVEKNIEDKLYEKLESNSKKTIKRDLADIKSFHHIDIKLKRNRGYYILEQDFIMSDELKEVFEKTELYLLHHHAQAWKQFVSISRTSLSVYVDMVALINAIDCKYMIEIDYKGWYDDNRFQKVKNMFQPLHIKEINNAWYLIAYNSEVGIYSLCLDSRINGLFITNRICKHPITFNEAEYFKNSIGILNSDLQAEWIHIKVANHHFKYLESNPMHHSQVIVARPLDLDTQDLNYADERIWGEIKIYVEPTYEFFMQILKFNRWVKIISPSHVVADMKLTLKQISEYYN
ncbi:helix-turn-helix transcriptional regulator [Formosa sp. PL04]|uniref:helix-turn-helix transcriptional regulator n=1 Tax=Formosa sp. PL04 TaxID=3081755 RepID=UPI002982492A|nr:WYL domain-containing protein [Formosa sp. PL04]MDW5288578.1 WYL domain-containing protein [Formosa sp. PL04]